MSFEDIVIQKKLTILYILFRLLYNSKQFFPAEQYIWSDSIWMTIIFWQTAK